MVYSAEFFQGRIDSFEVIILNIRKLIIALSASLSMVALILDSRAGIAGAAAGVDLCIQTLIPSLFPFFIFSILLTGSLLGHPIRLLRPVSKFCRIPCGSESLLAIGFLGGYPVGAQNVVFAREQGFLSDDDAQRMIVLCNNAGPAFIFGFLGQFFLNPLCPWILWLIHIFSAIVTGYLLPGGTRYGAIILKPKEISLSDSLEKSLHVMGKVCGWVILFRIILEFLQKWILWRLPVIFQIALTGLLELSNGCLLLQNLSSDGGRFLLASTLLGFGGFCVFLQTYSITKNFPFRFYLLGKLLHGCISFLMAYSLQFFFLEECIYLSPYIPSFMIILILLFAVIIRKSEKPVAISSTILYNQKSCEKRRTLCCFGKRLQNPAPTAFMAPN